MSGVDWPAALAKYMPLTERVSTRSELADVLREMAAELGASHCFEDDGDFGCRSCRRGDRRRRLGPKLPVTAD